MRYHLLFTFVITLSAMAFAQIAKAEKSSQTFNFDAQTARGVWVAYDWPELESSVGKSTWNAQGLLIDCGQVKTQYGLASWLVKTKSPNHMLRCRVQIKTQGNVFAAIGVAYHRQRQTADKSRQDFVHSPEYRSAQWKTVQWKIPMQTAPFTALVLYAGGQGQVRFRKLEVNIISSSQQAIDPTSPQAVAFVKDVKWEAEPQDVVANETLFGKKVFHAIEGVSLPIIFRYRGSSSLLKNPGLLIDVPKGIEVVGSRCNHFGVFSPERVQPVKSVNPGRQIYRVDQLGAMKILKTNWGWRRSSSIFLLAKRAFDEPVTLRYAEYNGSDQASWKSIEVEVLPPLKPLTEKPALSVVPWSQKDIALPEDGPLLESMLKAYEQAGVTTAQIARSASGKSKSYPFEQRLIRRGWTGFLPITDLLHDPLKDATHLQLEKMTSADGKTLNALCPTYALEVPEVRKAYFKSLEKQIQVLGMAAAPNRNPWIALDLELWGEKRVKTACFDDRCRQAFAKRLHLSTTPSVQKIRKRYMSQWATFRHDQTDQVSKVTADYIHRKHPAMVVAYYDYPIALTAREEKRVLGNYPANTRLYDDDLDIHLMSFYRPTDLVFFDLLAHATDQLNKPVVPITMINTFSPAYSSHSPPQVYMEMMASGLLGSPGFSVWTGEGMDGAYLSAMNQAQVDLSPWKSSVAQSERVKSLTIIGEGSKNARCILRQDEDQILLAVFNYSTQPATSLKVRSAALTGYEGVVGRTYLIAELAPKSVLIVSLKKLSE